jgi:hypothetical protein
MSDESAQKPDLKVVPKGDPADIFNDLAALRKASKLTVKRQTVLVNVPVGKPPNNVYFRVHPDIMLEDATVIRDEEGTHKKFYFITPSMREHPKLAPRLRYVTIHLVCTWPGDGILLWPVSAAADFAAWRSEQAAARLAKDKWTQLVWNRDRADFNVETAENIDRQPTWPKESFEQLLKLGYADCIVDNEDHYYVRRLRGIID